jgi:uncharacterized protein
LRRNEIRYPRGVDRVPELDVRLLPQPSESFSAGLRLYAERLDKEYSMTDCISIAIMKVKGMTGCATGDRHFEQEGYRALFRS